MRIKIAVLCSAFLLAWTSCSPRRTVAEWTVMVYLNGDNSLEGYAVEDFLEMAAVGSTKDVNIIVQFDRQPYTRLTTPDWSQTLRFRVTKDMKPIPSYAFADLGEQDMSSGNTVAEFVRTTRNAFPARRYAFIIWGHGAGPRLFVRNLATLPLADAARTRKDAREQGTVELAMAWSFKVGTGDGSSDPYDNLLYNRELVDALVQVLGDDPLDVFLFDECVMGMVENAYALRKAAKIMVASEELIPSDGFEHAGWVDALVRDPRMSSSQFAGALLRSYRRSYREAFGVLTMSALDLSRVEPLERAISRLATAMRDHFADNRDAILAARLACPAYGGGGTCLSGCMHHVDLQRFCEELLPRTPTPAIRDAAKAVIAAHDKVIIGNVAGSETRRSHGSNGLAIYFPPDGNSYCADDFNECGYERRNTRFPLEFVRDSNWTDFLHYYFQSIPDYRGVRPPLRPCRSATIGCS